MGHRRRWILRWLGLTPLVVLALVLIVAESPLTRWVVVSRLERALGVQVSARSARITSIGEISVSDVRLRVPGVSGRAGTFLTIDKIRMGVRWGRLLRGGPAVDDVLLFGPVLRLSQSRRDGSLNMASLRLPRSRASATAPDLPRVIVADGTLELGEHGDGPYRALRSISVAGGLNPTTRQGEHAYVMRLHERTASSSGPAIDLTGRIDAAGTTIELHHLSLSDWSPGDLPTPTRALWKRLDPRGDISGAELAFGRDGIQAKVDLRDVSMNLPIRITPAGPRFPPIRSAGSMGDMIVLLYTPPREQDGAFVRMHGVSGWISLSPDGTVVDVSGLLEDIPYRVRLDYDGSSLDAPFRAEVLVDEYQMQPNSRILPFLPEGVRRRLLQFSGAEAVLSSRVVIRRGKPTSRGRGAVRFEGSAYFKHGVAAYEFFPYPFRELEGRISFNNDRIVIDSISGGSPSGATVVAEGSITPDSALAEVDLRIDVFNVPIDESLRRALGPRWGRFQDELFSEDRRRELIESGLVIEPTRVDALKDELERLGTERARAPADRVEQIDERIRVIQRRLEAPVFEFGGRVDLSIALKRAHESREWRPTIEARMARAGILPRVFPYPIRARDVVIRIERDRVRVEGGRFEGLHGGTAQIEADVVVPSRGSEAEQDQSIRVTTGQVPIDELLIGAIPDPIAEKRLDWLGAGSEAERAPRVRDVLRMLNLSGRIRCEAAIRPGARAGRVGYDVRLALDDLSARPEPTGIGEDEGKLGFIGVDGTIKVSPERVAVDLSGRIASGDASPGAPFRLGANVEFPEGAGGGGEGGASGWTYTGTLWANGVSLALPIEDVLGLLSPSGRERLAQIRARRRPAGVIDARMDVSGRAGSMPDTTARISNLRGVSVDALGGRIALDRAAGNVSLRRAGGGVVGFDGFESDLIFDGQPAGHVKLSGDLPLEPGAAGGAARDLRPLSVALTDGRLGSPLIRNAVRSGMGEHGAEPLEAMDVHGRFDATVRLDPHAEGLGERGGAGVEATIIPRSLSLTRRGQRIVLEDLAGEIRVRDGRVRIDRFRGSGGAWSVGLDGWAEGLGEGSIGLDVDITLDGAHSSPDLIAILPEKVAKLLEGMKARAGGAFRMEGAHLRVDKADGAAAFNGRLFFEDASVLTGVQVDQGRGLTDIRYTRSARGQPGDTEVDVIADSFDVAGIRMTRGRLRVVGHGALATVPLISADCHGGRFAGEAAIEPAGDASGKSRRYTATVSFSGAGYTQIVADLKRSMGDGADQPGSGGGAAPARAEAGDSSDSGETEAGARLDAWISLEGLVHDAATRTGRGWARVAGGRVIDLPGLMPMVEVASITLPTGEALEMGGARFLVQGSEVAFESLWAMSRSVELFGYGRMGLPDLDLDLRFRSKAVRSIPLVSDVMDQIRDELFTIRVGGRLGKPEVRVEQFTGAKRLIGLAMGSPEARRLERLRQIERRAKREKTRQRWFDRTAPARGPEQRPVGSSSGGSGIP